MAVQSVGGCALVALGALLCVAAAGGRDAPRFSLSSSTAVQGDKQELGFRSGAPTPTATTRLYLVPVAAASSVRSRFDARLHFIGTIEPSRRARRVFTVPPLQPGTYQLAYWCRGCLPRGTKLGIERTPRLRISAPETESCPANPPNGEKPPEAPRTAWSYFGNGHLAVLLPAGSPNLTTNSLGGYKMFWVARQGLFGTLRVTYSRFDMASTPIRAVSVTGSLGGYDGPSWASRMSFEPGCWLISARVFDVSLSFIAQVERGTG